MEIKIFQVDAFAGQQFSGNPAAVCPLDEWIPDSLMQSIALENNLSETAFFVVNERPLRIRWFTPVTEVELCGHATLGSAHVLAHHLKYVGDSITFNSLSGELRVYIDGDSSYTLDFPHDILQPVPPDHPYLAEFDQEILESWRGSTDYLLRLRSQQAVESVKVNFGNLSSADGRGFIVTAEGDDCDYVARCFYPQTGINEDPATGSSHTTLAPFWSQRLNKHTFKAQQLSSRGASFKTSHQGDRVLITGSVVSYMEGIIKVHDVVT